MSLLNLITLNQWGLLLNIIGVVILFQFGLPSKLINEAGPSIIAEHSDEKLKAIKRHNSRIRRMAKCGLALIFVGFVLQFVSELE